MFKRLIALSIIFNFITLNAQVMASEVQSFGRSSNVEVIKNLLIPSDSLAQIMLTKDISSAKLSAGSSLIAVLQKDITLNNGKIIPQQSIITGSVLNAANAKKAGKNAFVDAKFYEILTPKQEKYKIKARIKTVDGTGVLQGGDVDKQLAKSMQVGAASTTGGAIAGGAVGTAVGGAAVGLATGFVAGAILGGAWIIGRKGKDVYIPIGTNLLIEFEEPLVKI